MYHRRFYHAILFITLIIRYGSTVLHQLFYLLQFYFTFRNLKAVADPGFPVGGLEPRKGGMDSRGGYVSKILYVKTKESGPLGGGACAGHPPM